MPTKRIETPLGKGEILKPENVDFPFGMGLDLECVGEDIDVEDLLTQNRRLLFMLLEKFGFIRLQRTKRFKRPSATKKFFYVPHSDGQDVAALQAIDTNNPRTYGTFFTALSPFWHSMFRGKEIGERGTSPGTFFNRDVFAFCFENALHVNANSDDPEVRAVMRETLEALQSTTLTHNWLEYPMSTILFRENFSSGNTDRLLHGTTPTEDQFLRLQECGGDVSGCENLPTFNPETDLIPGLRTKFNEALYRFLSRQQPSRS